MQLSLLGKMLYGASRKISENKEKLNSLNVFPIPDGDTGINMEKTMSGAVQVLVKLAPRELAQEDLDDLYQSILMASQGNSGVILSQWFKGFLGALKEAEAFDTQAIYQAFLEGSEAAYNAVTTPVEGTFLTVAREACEAAEEYIEEEDLTVEKFLRYALEGAKESVDNTPLLLPVLKEAGVVDSGGLGFALILSGMLEACTGEFQLDISQFAEMAGASYSASAQQKFGYCTEIILELDDNVADFRCAVAVDYLNTIGDSVVAVRNDRLVKVHVHTHNPELVLSFFHKYGEFRKIKIDNMTLQNREMLSREKGRYAVIAVADGEKLAEIFCSMGVRQIVQGGQSKNPSVGSMLEAIRQVQAETVLLLPNNKNISLVAHQAVEASGQSNIVVIETETMAEGYAALKDADWSLDTQTLAAAMTEKARSTLTGAVAVADRSVTRDGIEIRRGDYIAFFGETVQAAENTKLAAAGKLLDHLPGKEKRRCVTVFCSSEPAQEEKEFLFSHISGLMPDAKTELLVTGQPVLEYIFCIE